MPGTPASPLQHLSTPLASSKHVSAPRHQSLCQRWLPQPPASTAAAAGVAPADACKTVMLLARAAAGPASASPHKVSPAESAAALQRSRWATGGCGCQYSKSAARRTTPGMLPARKRRAACGGAPLRVPWSSSWRRVHQHSRMACLQAERRLQGSRRLLYSSSSSRRRRRAHPPQLQLMPWGKAPRRGRLAGRTAAAPTVQSATPGTAACLPGW